MVNFVCQSGLPRLKIISVCPWGCFWLKLALQFVDSWSRLSPTVWIGVIQSTEGLNRAKTEEGRIHPLSSLTAWSGTSLLSCPHLGFTPLASLVFRPSDSDRFAAPAFLALQLAGDTQRDFSASTYCEATLQNQSLNHSLSLSLHTPLVLFLWITPTNAGKGMISDPFRASRKLLLQEAVLAEAKRLVTLSRKHFWVYLAYFWC